MRYYFVIAVAFWQMSLFAQVLPYVTEQAIEKEDAIQLAVFGKNKVHVQHEYEVYSDNQEVLKRELIFNKKGQLIRDCNYNNDNKIYNGRTFKYNGLGQISSLFFFESDTLDLRSEKKFMYRDDGQLLKTEIYRIQYKGLKFERNEDDVLIRIYPEYEYSSPDITEYEYNDKGNITSRREISSSYEFRTIFKTDINGCITEEMHLGVANDTIAQYVFWPDAACQLDSGIIGSRFTNEFNDNGMKVRTLNFTYDDRVSYEIYFEYNDYGQLITEKSFSTGYMHHKTIEYNEKNLPVKRFDGLGSVEDNFVYKYDFFLDESSYTEGLPGYWKVMDIDGIMVECESELTYNFVDSKKCYSVLCDEGGHKYSLKGSLLKIDKDVYTIEAMSDDYLYLKNNTSQKKYKFERAKIKE